MGHSQYSSDDAGSKVGDTTGFAPDTRWSFTEDTEDTEPEDETWLSGGIRSRRSKMMLGLGN